ncbi:UNVERIFIED_CONTAM: hypothetical protein RMT77_017382 [Armadillidium vulgare]
MALNLKELLLHKNQIKVFTNFKSNFPQSLVKLTLAENSIETLGEISKLSNLKLLKELTIMKNMCVNVLQLVDLQGNPVGSPRSFDYRPFVVAVCSNLTKLDFKPISKNEKLKATWLLSQEQFKQISLQNHASLVCYLSDVCPLSQTVFEGEYLERNEGNDIQTIQNHSQVNLKSTILNSSSVNECYKRSIPESKFHKPRKANVTKPLKGKKNTPSSFKGTEKDCMTPYPCKHYIELIEEKAKNYKLKRSNEALTQENVSLCQRLQILETTLEENAINIRDVLMKIEIEDEDAT